MPPLVDDQLAAIKTNGESFQTVTLFAQKDMGVMSKTREMIRTATLTMHDHENDVCLSRNILNSQRASRTKKKRCASVKKQNKIIDPHGENF